MAYFFVKKNNSATKVIKHLCNNNKGSMAWFKLTHTGIATIAIKKCYNLSKIKNISVENFF